MGRQNAPSGEVGGKEESHPATRWEWGVAALGLVLLLAVMAYLLVDAFTASTAPPDPVLAVEAVDRLDGGGFLVRIRVQNRGQRTAAKLRVAGTLATSQGGKVEEAECEFDYVPAQSVRHGGLFFRSDPNRLQLQLQARGYIEP